MRREPAIQGRGELRALVHTYIEDVLSGRRLVGKWERLAVERHLRDIERASTDPTPGAIRFDESRALHVLRFAVRHVRHYKGEWRGQRFRFSRESAWQAFVLWSLFGWLRYDDENGWVRRFRSAYIAIARKNGKTMLGAIIALYLLAFDGEGAPEVYFAATKRDQAKIGWNAAKAIVRQSPQLRRLIKVVESRSNMHIPEDDAVCEALGRDADTLDGTNPHAAIVDELHAHKTRDVWDVLESGQGARRQSLQVGITTAGSNREAICGDLDHDSERILDGVIEDDTLFAYIARLDPEDDWADIEVLAKANPNLGVSVKVQTLRDGITKAKNNVRALNEFLRKRCNMWTSADTAWLPIDAWDACDGPVDLDALVNQPCFVGLDIGATNDLTSAAAVFPRNDGEWFDIVFKSWCPADTIPERVKRDRVPFDRWRAAGFIEATDGNVVDQDAVKAWLLSFRERHNVREVAMDPWAGLKLSVELQAHGFVVANHRQGFVSMSPAMKEAEKLILAARVHHGGDPVARWAFSNVCVKTSAEGNIKPDKGTAQRARKRIDPIVAAIMGIGRALAHETKPTPQVWVLEG